MVELFVKPFGATKYQSLNLLENISLPITYSIADIRNPEKREGTFTKTIALPGTKTNNTLFANIFNISKVTQYATDFNPNKKADCLILEDSIEILKGSLRLVDISYLENGEILYNCVVFGETSDLFFSIGNDKLTDLNLSAYDHNWSQLNISNSWSATKGIGYVYPMIDYGTNLDPMKERWDVRDFFPAIYVKQYIDTIFASSGYSYTSAFFNTDFFKSLIIPFNKQNLKLTPTDILQRSASVSMLADELKTVTINKYDISSKRFAFDYTYSYWDWTKEVSDPNNNFVLTGFQAPKNGLYDINLFFDCSSSDMVTFPTGTSAVANRYLEYSVNIINLTTGLTLANNKRVLLINDAVSVLPVKTPWQQRVYLNAGDVIKTELHVFNLWEFTTAASGTTGTASFGIDNDSYFRVTAVEQLSENSPITISSIIPENVFCKDFISGIIKMFNLYIEPDKNNIKNLIIKPRDTFYSDETNTLNWSDKVNRDTPWKITPLGELDFKKLTFSYKDDQDFYNKRYKNSYSESYGTKQLIIDNDFLNNEKKIEPLFSATPNYRPDKDSISPRIYPIIVNDQIQRTGSNIRILQYAGLKFTAPFTFYSSIYGGSLINTYPFAGMIDDADNPTSDLCFDAPQEIYWTMNPANYTNNNLYNMYYYKMISEISDVDSKLVELEVLLTAQDLFNINFAKKIFIDNQYYILNKIIDADRTQTQLCKVELLKLKVGNPFTPRTGVSKGYNNAQSQVPTVEGGANIVGSSLNGSPAIVEGGLNEVRSISATSEILIVNGGLN